MRALKALAVALSLSVAMNVLQPTLSVIVLFVAVDVFAPETGSSAASATASAAARIRSSRFLTQQDRIDLDEFE